MRPFFKTICSLLIFLFFTQSGLSQTEFFSTKINFTENQLENFYSSISIDSTQIYFNANDYMVHAYNKKNGNLNWSYYTANKSNCAPKLNQNSVFVEKHFSEYNDKCIQLNLKTGDTIQTLKIQSMYTEPIFKGDLMYCAAIYPEIGGAIMGYDLKKNDVIWSKFIAHGVSVQPYFFNTKIVANAESDNWISIDYEGGILEKGCHPEIYLDTIGICVKKFKYLTHDKKEISENLLSKYFDELELKVKYTEEATFILGENKLLVLGKKGKVRNEISIDKIVKLQEIKINSYKEILRVNSRSITFLYENIIVEYDYNKNKIIKIFDVTSWNPHQAILDGKNLWLVSLNTGELVGLELK